MTRSDGPRPIIDWRSDTVTRPTPAMRRAMAGALVGDDFYGEDPSVRELEAATAKLFDKRAALFVCSGTMANQIAIMALTDRADEIVVSADSHIYNLEVGAVAAFSGVQTRVLSTRQGQFEPSALEAVLSARGIQRSPIRVVCLENTYSLNAGLPLTAEYEQSVSRVAHAHDAHVYLDGARIFNAAAALNTTVAALSAPVDALQFCLTKGLGAPFGSMLVGELDFIAKARVCRQRMGGGLRQAGHMAAAAQVALDEGTMHTFERDHRHAVQVAEGLAQIDPRLVDVTSVKTNIVCIDLASAGLDVDAFTRALENHGIRIKPLGRHHARLVAHCDIDDQSVERTLLVFRELFRDLSTEPAQDKAS